MTEITVGIVKANVFSLAFALPLVVLSVFLFSLHNPVSMLIPTHKDLLWIVIAFLPLVVAHELLHGVTWALFSEHHFSDIGFGFMAEYLTPYCTCKSPLTKGAYIAGAMMPCLMLGIVPAVVSVFLASRLLFWIGILMTISAGGDIFIVAKMLSFKGKKGEERFYFDHPTKAGLAVFER